MYVQTMDHGPYAPQNSYECNVAQHKIIHLFKNTMSLFACSFFSLQLNFIVLEYELCTQQY